LDPSFLVLFPPASRCDRARANPNQSMKSFACKIKPLLKIIVLLYNPSCHANARDAGPCMASSCPINHS
jgi:hypothetical protein